MKRCLRPPFFFKVRTTQLSIAKFVASFELASILNCFLYTDNVALSVKSPFLEPFTSILR